MLSAKWLANKTMAGGIRHSKFVALLKRCNRKLQVNKLGGIVWGLSLDMPRHPDANEHGKVPLISIPSATVYNGYIPAETLKDDNGIILVRGWKVILRLLVSQGHFKRSQVNSLFGSDWEIA